MTDDFKPGDRVFIWDSPNMQGVVIEVMDHRTRVRRDDGSERAWYTADLEWVTQVAVYDDDEGDDD